MILGNVADRVSKLQITCWYRVLGSDGNDHPSYRFRMRVEAPSGTSSLPKAS
jgi:hypothetical protein